MNSSPNVLSLLKPYFRALWLDGGIAISRLGASYLIIPYDILYWLQLLYILPPCPSQGPPAHRTKCRPDRPTLAAEQRYNISMHLGSQGNILVSSCTLPKFARHSAIGQSISVITEPGRTAGVAGMLLVVHAARDDLPSFSECVQATSICVSSRLP